MMSSTTATPSASPARSPLSRSSPCRRAEIAERLVAKECLRRAFISIGVPWWESPVPPDTHGEFGRTNEWTDNADRRTAIDDWLRTSPEVAEIAAAVARGPGCPAAADLEQFARSLLFTRIVAASGNQELSGDGLAERLAEGAVLPMYGMPSRSRFLFHELGRDFVRDIDRDLDLAITEFAPGSERTKDKRIHQPIGFTAPYLNRNGRWEPASNNPLPDRRWMQRCEQCHFTRTSDTEPAAPVCPECGCAGYNATSPAVPRVPVRCTARVPHEPRPRSRREGRGRGHGVRRCELGRVGSEPVHCNRGHEYRPGVFDFRSRLPGK